MFAIHKALDYSQREAALRAFRICHPIMKWLAERLPCWASSLKAPTRKFRELKTKGRNGFVAGKQWILISFGVLAKPSHVSSAKRNVGTRCAIGGVNIDVVATTDDSFVHYCLLLCDGLWEKEITANGSLQNRIWKDKYNPKEPK